MPDCAPSSTLPPWFETMMPAAPACMALRAPFTLMIPFRITGLDERSHSAFSSLTSLKPTGTSLLRRLLSPLASMSDAIAGQLLSFTRSTRQSMCPIAHGLIVGTPTPPAVRMASIAPWNTAASTPSPVKAAMPLSAQALTRMLLYSRSVYFSP